MIFQFSAQSSLVPTLHMFLFLILFKVNADVWYSSFKVMIINP
jgi:hypothetical protein